MRAHCVLIIWFTRMPSKHQRIHFNIISKRLCALEHIFVSMISPLLHKCMNVCKMSTRVISTIIDDFNGRLWRMALQSICIGLMLFSTYASIIAQSHPEQSTSIASKINIIFHRIFAGESVRKKISERRRGKKHRVRSVCVCAVVKWKSIYRCSKVCFSFAVFSLLSALFERIMAIIEHVR